MTRREIRDSAFKLIFEKLLRDDPIEELYDIAGEIDEIIVNDKVKEIVEGVLSHEAELDEIIGGISKARNLSRIDKINLAILRIAVYEIKYDDGTPMNAAISEAVNLSETYSYKEDIGFVNGVLSSYAKQFPEAAESNGNV